MSVRFFTEDISFSLKQKNNVRKWIRTIIDAEGQSLKDLNFIFCSDAYLLDLNQKFLKHTTYTDIITFDNSENADYISGEVFISIERARENAVKYQVSETNELHRLIIHGILHLLGYMDKTPKDKALMTSKENKYLDICDF